MSTGRRWRTVRRALVFAVAGATFALLIASASGTLTGSTFNAGDGNMKVEASDPHDWKDASTSLTSFSGFLGDPVNSGADDSFDPGQNMDTPCPVITGHRPPGKDDFSGVAYGTEVNPTSGDTYFYGMTVRLQANGNANENLELNKSDDGCRSAGDRLIAIDYLSGGTAAQFNLLTWTETLNTPCENGGVVTVAKPGCWGVHVALDPVNEEAYANQSNILAADSITGGSVAKLKFAEFGINLSAGPDPIIDPDECEGFALVRFESRSSGSSFGSQPKDVVDGNIGVSNCGRIDVTKEDDADPANALANVTFALWEDTDPSDGDFDDTVDVDTGETCTTDADGECSFEDLAFGDYWLVEDESTVPSGLNAADPTPVSVTEESPIVGITIVDPRSPGSVSIHKEDDGGNLLDDVTFTLYADDGDGLFDATKDTVAHGSCTTGSGNDPGECTIGQVPLDTDLWVVESNLGSDYSADADLPKLINLSTGGDDLPLSFENPRKHRVIVLVCHQGTDTLDQSGVTVDSTTKQSLAKGSLTEAQENALCNLGGASFDGSEHGDTVAPSVAIAP